MKHVLFSSTHPSLKLLTGIALLLCITISDMQSQTSQGGSSDPKNDFIVCGYCQRAIDWPSCSISPQIYSNFMTEHCKLLPNYSECKGFSGSNAQATTPNSDLLNSSTEALTYGLMHNNAQMVGLGVAGALLNGILSAPARTPEQIARDRARQAELRRQEEERLRLIEEARQRAIEEERRRFEAAKQSTLDAMKGDNSLSGISRPKELSSGAKA